MAERVFALPDLGEGLEEGRIVEWLVREGDEVTLNQPLVEVETAKAAVEIPSPFAGVIRRLHGAVDDDVPVGSPLVTYEIEGAGREPAPAPMKAGAPVPATPPARKVAKDLGVEIASVEGTGPGGRVTEADVRRVAADGGDATPVMGVFEDLQPTRLPADRVRRAIADSLTRQSTIPQVTTFRTVDCAALDELRRELETSPLPVVIAAIARSIGDHPLLNASWVEDAVELRGAVNVGVAVDTERGLMVPVVRDADQLGIARLSAEITRLADAARADTLPIDDKMVSATIAVSNTGAYGSEAGTPILSPGTSVTIAFGVIAPRALILDGEVVARPAATISLTFDHRVLDGAAAGRFLTDLVAVLQSPDRLRDLPR